MKSAVRRTVMCAVVAMLSCSAIQAQALVGDDPAPAGRHFQKMSRELGLTAQQMQQVKEIFNQHRTAVEPLRKQLAGERRSLASLVQADVVDEAAIRAQSAKVAALQADLAVQRAQLGQELRKVMTAEQSQKFKALQGREHKRGRLAKVAPCAELEK